MRKERPSGAAMAAAARNTATWISCAVTMCFLLPPWVAAGLDRARKPQYRGTDARDPRGGAAIRTTPWNRQHACGQRRSGAHLVADSDWRLARRPEIDEWRPHPSTVTVGINTREGRCNPSAAVRIDLGERRAHIGAGIAAKTA